MDSPFPDKVCSEEVLQGSPRLSGTRLSIGDIVSLAANYGTFEEVKTDFELSPYVIKEALLYCSNQRCLTDRPKVYCHNCSMRYEQDGLPDLFDLQEQQLGDTTIVKDGTTIFLGSKEEYLNEMQGHRWWEIATDSLITLRNEPNK